MARFVYSSYWRTWSRVLLNDYDLVGSCVEIDLTPVNGTDWARVATENIRRHTTDRGVGDKLVWELPKEVEQTCRRHLGDQLFDRMLTYDYLPEIDWKLYSVPSNGGAPFEKIRVAR